MSTPFFKVLSKPDEMREAVGFEKQSTAAEMMMPLQRFTFDPDIIPDKKERYRKEAFEYIKRAAALNDAIHYLKLNREKVKLEALKFARDVDVNELIKERDNLMDAGIEVYLESKK